MKHVFEAVRDALLAEVAHVEVDVLLVDAAPFVHLGQFGTGDHVTRSEFAVVVRVAVLEHEPLALAVVEDSTFAAHTLGDENPGRGKRRRVELDELHVLQRDAGTVRHRGTVAGVGHRVRRVVEHLSESAGRQDDAVFGGESLYLAGLDVVADDAVTGALGGVVLVRDGELGDVPLVVHLNAAFDDLLVHGVEQVVTRLRTRVGRSGERQSTERSLGDASVVLAGERHPPVFELDGLFRAVLTEGFDRWGVAEIVRPLHGVVGVEFPVVAFSECRVDTAFRCAGVASNGMELRDEGDICALFVGRDGRTKPRTASTDDDYVVFVHCV